MDNDNESEVQIASRVSKTAYAKILARQKEAKRLTGIEPSISAIVRAIIEDLPDVPDGKNGKRR